MNGSKSDNDKMISMLNAIDISSNTGICDDHVHSFGLIRSTSCSSIIIFG